MSEDVDKIVKDAASNVACETKEVTSVETQEKMKLHLLGLSRESDASFIHGLVKNIKGQRFVRNGKRK